MLEFTRNSVRYGVAGGDEVVRCQGTSVGRVLMIQEERWVARTFGTFGWGLFGAIGGHTITTFELVRLADDGSYDPQGETALLRHDDSTYEQDALKALPELPLEVQGKMEICFRWKEDTPAE